MEQGEINTRIKEVIDDLEYPINAFAKRLGVSNGVLTKIVNGKSKPSMSILNKIVRTFPVERQWLWFGEDKKYSKSIERFKFSNEENLNKNAVYGDEAKGVRIKYIRSSVDLSQTQMAEELGTTRDVIAQIETGRNAPQSYILEGLYTIFGANVNWILTNKEQPFIDDTLAKELKKAVLLKKLKELD